jgi:hypothetical protein
LYQKERFHSSYISTCIFLTTLFIVIQGRLYSSSNGHRSCPEEYRELSRRDDDDSSSESDLNDQWRENACEQAMDIAARQRNTIKRRSILRMNCAHYDEALELAREKNDTLCEDKKREIDLKRKRQLSKKKRDDDFNDSDDNDDDDDKRRALLKRELKKRAAVTFIRKRML